MNSLLDDLDDDERGGNDRELTLSTATILGIFFGLVLLCGLFFGFGYKLGSHRSALPVEATTSATPTQPSSTFSDFKPAAGSPEGESSAYSPAAGGSGSYAGESSAAAAGASSSGVNSSGEAERPLRSEAAVDRESARTTKRSASTDLSAPAVPPASGSIFVQVAAVSHPEDAKLLVNALRAKGYPVSAHTQPEDKFFHIQVGPFESLQEAQATRQRLLSDGYQPIIK